MSLVIQQCHFCGARLVGELEELDTKAERGRRSARLAVANRMRRMELYEALRTIEPTISYLSEG